jgi:hypothetical protein
MLCPKITDVEALDNYKIKLNVITFRYPFCSSKKYFLY